MSNANGNTVPVIPAAKVAIRKANALADRIAVVESILSQMRAKYRSK